MIVVLRGSTPGAAAATVIVVAALAGMSAAALAASAPATPDGAFTVRSTLAGNAVLPHRISWLGIPSLAAAQIKEVDFWIDGRLRWKEQKPPYTYANDGNYLVTSALPGIHHFRVDAISTDNGRATVSTDARVAPAPRPPAGLAGTWERVLSKEDVAGAIDSAPGRWRLTVDRVGWRFRDPGTHGALVDVAYLGPRLLEARSGIATKLPGVGDEGNVWCDAPYQPVRYRWSVTGSTLSLTLAGPKRCDGQSQVWAGDWTRR